MGRSVCNVWKRLTNPTFFIDTGASFPVSNAANRLGHFSGLPEAQHLPAVMWKQRNLAQLPDAKRRGLVDALERVLLP